MIFAVGQHVLPAFSGMRLQYQADVLVSIAACSRMPLASQFRSIGVSRHRSVCLVMASDVRKLRDGRRHRLAVNLLSTFVREAPATITQPLPDAGLPASGDATRGHPAEKATTERVRVPDKLILERDRPAFRFQHQLVSYWKVT